jgi:hypothetical protein
VQLQRERRHFFGNFFLHDVAQDVGATDVDVAFVVVATQLTRFGRTAGIKTLLRDQTLFRPMANPK